MEWISVKERLPELIDGEPQEVLLCSDELEKFEGFYENGDWWIKLPSPFVGHQCSSTFPYDINITHWRPPTPTER